MRYQFAGSIHAVSALEIARQIATEEQLAVEFNEDVFTPDLQEKCESFVPDDETVFVFYAGCTDFSECDTKEYYRSLLSHINKAGYAKVIICVDHPLGVALATNATVPTVKVTSTYGQSADWYGAVTRNDATGVSFVSQGSDDGYFRARATGFGQILAGVSQVAIVALYQAGLDLGKISEIESVAGFLNPVITGVAWFGAVYSATHLSQILDEICEIADALTVVLLEPFSADAYPIGAMLAGAANTLVLCGDDTDVVIAGAEASGARCEILCADDLTDAVRVASAEKGNDHAILFLTPAAIGDFNEQIALYTAKTLTLQEIIAGGKI